MVIEEVYLKSMSSAVIRKFYVVQKPVLTITIYLVKLSKS